MSEVLSTSELRAHLDRFKELFTHFDYSALTNVRFINLKSLIVYMDTIPHNPFRLQYHSLQQELDFLEPYLPFTSSNRAREFLNALSNAATDEEVEAVKKVFSTQIKQDLLIAANGFTMDTHWENLFAACESIRLKKEESLLALT
jgi:hypothetical protein